jgi:hypothetical protein
LSVIRIPNNWRPRDYQLASWQAFERGVRRQILIWHRRAGKDEVALNKAAVAAHQRVANYWHCLPEYSQARKAIWEAINPHTGRKRIDEAFPGELRARTDAQTMTIEFKCGSIWRVVGSDNPDSLVGAPPAGIVFSEWAISNPTAWAYLAPILAENNGWAEFITTPRGRNHAKSMYDMALGNPAWFAQILTVDDTKSISLEAVEEQRLEYHSLFGLDAGDALIEQEYWCSFEAAVLGSYWGRELAALEKLGQIRGVPVDPEAPVHVAWDLGVGDSTALWFFQMVGREIHIIDFYEANGYAVGHFANVKKDKGYSYGDDFVPHDALQRSWTDGDPDDGGKARQRIEVMLDHGLKPKIVPLHGIQDGISAVRQTLPRCWFDRERCKDGIERLRQYRADWDDKKKVFRNIPRHDWTSHAADAFRYLAMAWRPIEKPVEPQKPKFLQDATLDDLWTDTERRRAGGRI